MSQRNDFDGGGLLSLFGFEDDSSERPRGEPQHLSPPPDARQAPQAAPPPPPTPAQPSERPAAPRGGLDLTALGSDELVRAIVLADVLGPPPGRRGGRRG